MLQKCVTVVSSRVS